MSSITTSRSIAQSIGAFGGHMVTRDLQTVFVVAHSTRQRRCNIFAAMMGQPCDAIQVQGLLEYSTPMGLSELVTSVVVP
jgi:hypothetical protein